MINKRLLIYFFYDNDGIIDSYVFYMLDKLKQFVNNIIFVSNGNLNSTYKNKVYSYTQNIIERDNKGFDVYAYKAGLDYIGWENLFHYDEIIFVNHTIMGPVDTFNDMFSTMDPMNVDFWGITRGYQEENINSTGSITHIPEHIQSHFIAVRKSLFLTDEFKAYWENMQPITSYFESILKHEVVFTKYFADRGYLWDTFVHSHEIANIVPNAILFVPTKLIKNYKCPIFKRKSFFLDYVYYTKYSNGETALELLEYLKSNTSYDIDMIYENIIRSTNQADFNKAMHLKYILPVKYAYNQYNDKPKVALMLHLYFEDLFEETLNYAKNMPEYADIYISTQTLTKKQKIEELVKCFPNKVTVIIINNRGRDVSALTVGLKEYILNYDIVCFAHDKKVTQLGNGIKGESFSYMCYENILASKHFVSNVIDTFIEKKRLGILVPPAPQFADYYPVININNGWVINYQNSVNFAKRMNISVNMTEEKEPIAPFGSIFWFRVDALKPLFDLNLDYTDFPEEPLPSDGTISHTIERMHPFIAQSRGYYPAMVLSDKYAKVHITNIQYMHTELSKEIFKIAGYNIFSKLHCKLYEYKLKNEKLQNDQREEIDRLNKELSSLYNSKSWKITKPLRWLFNHFRHS